MLGSSRRRFRCNAGFAVKIDYSIFATASFYILPVSVVKGKREG